MKIRDFLPTREGDLVTWIGTFNTGIAALTTSVGLTSGQVTAYDGLAQDFFTKYATANSDATRSPMSIIAKDLSKKSVVAQTRVLSGIIQKFPQTTDEMRSQLGLNIPAARVSTPPPDKRPGVDLVSVIARAVRVRFHDIDSKRSKAPGCCAVNLYSFVGATYPSDPSQWQYEGSTTKDVAEILFPDSVANGAQVWICATWVNRKLQAGPPSVPISTNLQGGLSQAA